MTAASYPISSKCVLDFGLFEVASWLSGAGGRFLFKPSAAPEALRRQASWRIALLTGLILVMALVGNDVYFDDFGITEEVDDRIPIMT
jgi:hypothetical protein